MKRFMTHPQLGLTWSTVTDSTAMLHSWWKWAPLIMVDMWAHVTQVTSHKVKIGKNSRQHHIHISAHLEALEPEDLNSSSIHPNGEQKRKNACIRNMSDLDSHLLLLSLLVVLILPKDCTIPIPIPIPPLSNYSYNHLKCKLYCSFL